MTRRWQRLIALAVLALAAGAVPARAQDVLDRLVGRPIARVDLQVEGRPEASPPLLALIDIRPGDQLTLEAMRRVENRLGQLPRFERVRVLAEELPEGIRLVFDLEPRHPVDQLDFDGDMGLGESELNRYVRDQFDGVPALARLSDVQDVVVRFLTNEGYRNATATAEVVQFHNPDRATLVIHVNAGPRTLVGEIAFRGQSPFSRENVLSRLDLTEGQPYRERAIATELAAIRDDLRRRGFYTTIAQQQRTFDPSAARANVTITVDAGPLVRLVIDGPLPGSVDDFIPIERLGSVDRDLLDDARAETERGWRRRGYWRANVTYAEDRSQADTLVITFTIDRGRRYKVARVDLGDGLSLSAEDLAAYPALKPGAWFDQEAVVNALLRLKALYQERGFHLVTMVPAFEEVPDPRQGEDAVIIRPNITEGPKATVVRIEFDLGESPTVRESDLRAHMRARDRAPYSRANLFYDQESLQAYYESLGYLNREVTLGAQLNDAGTEAVLRVRAREGDRVTVGEITVVGNERLSREAILREITLATGGPYSEAARLESQRRLYDLQVFRSVRLTVEPLLPGETTARVIVSVEETSSITLGLGGGAEVGTRPAVVEGGGIEDRIEVSPRAFIELGRRNLGGKNRAVNFFARVGLKPRKSLADPTKDAAFGFTEYRVSGSYREHNAFRTNADIVFGVTSEQGVRTNFNFVRRIVNLDVLRPVSAQLTVSGRYSLEFTRLFDEIIPEEDQSLIDRLFPQVRLSTLSTAVLLDRRNSVISPTRGGQFSVAVDYAPRWLGSEVGFIKGFAQASLFKSVSAAPPVVLAGRAQLGLARGFLRSVPRVDENGDPILDPGGEPIVDLVADLPASQRFFAGGSTTVRGFQPDRLGVQKILNNNGLSDGGNALVVLNGEVRVQVGRLFDRLLSVVGFIDGGNVFDRVGDLDLTQFRAAAGFGVRYDSPFGPVRLDFGFKFDRLTFVNGRERRWEFHLSIGEVF